jgi:hypothetical protein
MHMFSFFKSYYVDDTAFILLSRRELVAASSLSSLTFDVSVWLFTPEVDKRKKEDSKTEAIHFQRPGQESSAADMEDIKIDEDRFMSFCFKFKCLGSYFVPELNDTADSVVSLNGFARLESYSVPWRNNYSATVSMKKQLLSNKQIPIDIRRIQALCILLIEKSTRPATGWEMPVCCVSSRNFT